MLPIKWCTVPLGGEGYQLDLDVLRACTQPMALKKRSWAFSTLRFVSYEDGTLTLQNTGPGATYRLVISVQKNHLLVGCNCTGEGEGLCLHAYKAILRMLDYREADYFKKYGPGGEVALALQHKHYFSTRWSFNDLRIETSKELGRVYSPGDAYLHKALATALGLPAGEESLREEPALEPPPQIPLCYLLISWPRRKMLPTLIPCLGRLNKAGTAVKGFEPFLSGTQKSCDHLHAKVHRVLNGLCYRLWKTAEGLPGTLWGEEASPDTAGMGEVFELWRQVWRLLPHQPFVFGYPLYRVRELRGRPQKKRVQQIRPCREKPRVVFRLTEKEHFFQLDLLVLIGARKLLNFESGGPFFIRQGDRYYLLVNLRDAALVEWMGHCGGRLTVFKEHYPAFETTVLSELKKHYQLERASGPRRTPAIGRYGCS